MKPLTTRTARATVAIIFLAACLVCLGCVLVARVRNVILWEDAKWLLTSLAEVYSLPIAALLGASLAGESHGVVAGIPFVIIVILAVAWNLVLVYAFATLPLTQQFQQSEIVDLCSLFSRRFSFLIAGALTYLTGKSATWARRE